MKPKLLLHVCCAPCATFIFEKLKKDFEVSAFYYNPNIYPKKEYELRKQNFVDYALKVGLPLFEGEYEPQEYFKAVKGKEDSQTTRCPLCYALRLKKTATLAKEKGFDYFSTTLLISPYQNQSLIKEIGEELTKKMGLAPLDKNHQTEIISGNNKSRSGLTIPNHNKYSTGLNFYFEDFTIGYYQSRKLSQEFNLYRQKYCGCVFSR